MYVFVVDMLNGKYKIYDYLTNNFITDCISEDEVIDFFQEDFRENMRNKIKNKDDFMMSKNIKDINDMKSGKEKYYIYKFEVKVDGMTFSDLFEFTESEMEDDIIKKGDNHYDNISAFIKSMRGSDPDASMLWMVKMLDAGEDPKFIARRMVIFASEDIGNANPKALNVAVNTFKAIEVIGLPEAEINMAQCVTYLASSPKSNAAYMALKEAKSFIRTAKSLDVPLHIRNAPTKLMKAEGYSEGYKYPHNYDGHFVKENYMPEGAEDVKFYEPTELGDEKEIKDYLEKNWGKEKGK